LWTLHQPLERHRDRVKSLHKRLEAFLEEPSAENLHDLRTAVRRVDASVNSLPRRLRERRKTNRLLGKLERLMKRSAKVRDLDTVQSRLTVYGTGRALGRLRRRVEKSRRKQVRSTVKAAASIRKLSILYTDAQDARETQRSEERIEKVVKRLSSRLNRRLPVVLSDPDDKEALHALRKDCKRLRYILELTPQEGEGSGLVMTLTSWQDLLGAVRDGDVTVEYLEGLERSAPVDKVLRAERARRRQDYEGFAAACAALSTSIPG